jgi:class 3 adenylate cyclase
MFHAGGPRTRRLLSFLARREQQRPPQRLELDVLAQKALFRPRAVVFTDTADFTARTARDGIVHFLMIFNRAVAAAGPALREARGRVVKVEGDSLLLDFPAADDACRGVVAIERMLRRLNRAHPANERLQFGYGIGFGDILDIERDLFGLEVNLASKIGEDLARPGEALLTPAAAEAVGPQMRQRIGPYTTVRFGRNAYTITRLRLPR